VLEQIQKTKKTTTISRAVSPKEGVEAATYAIQGIRYALGDSSFLRLLIVQGIVLFMMVLFLLPISLMEIAVLLPAFALPLCTEIINVAVESIVDLVHPSEHKLAGKAKDCAAGATYVAVVFWLVAVGFVALNHFGFG